MSITQFDEEKNIFLKQTRGIDFEDILKAIDNGKLLDDIEHPNKKYKHQRLFIVEIQGYVYIVPYVQNKEGIIFLKTVYPSRYFTKNYLKNDYGKKRQEKK